MESFLLDIFIYIDNVVNESRIYGVELKRSDKLLSGNDECFYITLGCEFRASIFE